MTYQLAEGVPTLNDNAHYILYENSQIIKTFMNTKDKKLCAKENIVTGSQTLLDTGATMTRQRHYNRVTCTKRQHLVTTRNKCHLRRLSYRQMEVGIASMDLSLHLLGTEQLESTSNKNSSYVRQWHKLYLVFHNDHSMSKDIFQYIATKGQSTQDVRLSLP